jgi:RNA polymerase sigma-70 factor (ECF subfamily)
MGSDPGFEEVYRAEYGQVCKTVFLSTGDWGLAEEAAQEAFARALARWGRLRQHHWIGGWITTTALNVARRALRKRPGSIQSDVAYPDTATDDLIDLHRVVRGLPQRQQEAVLLYYVADHPLSQVAEAMGCREGTVKAHLDKARRSLRRALEEAPADER